MATARKMEETVSTLSAWNRGEKPFPMTQAKNVVLLWMPVAWKAPIKAEPRRKPASAPAAMMRNPSRANWKAMSALPNPSARMVPISL
jgi:hypothetical protein